MMNLFDLENLSPTGRSVALWGLRLTAVAAVVLAVGLTLMEWNKAIETQQNALDVGKLKVMDDRDVAQLNVSDSADLHQEQVRWINLFLEDIIITSDRPHPLKVEEAPAAKVEKYVSPEDAPSRVGEDMSAGEGNTPPPSHSRRYPHSDGTDDDSTAVRPWSFRASLQGTKRLGVLARYNLNSSWSFEAGVENGYLKTNDSRHLSIGTLVNAIYRLGYVGPLSTYAIGGLKVDDIRQDHVPLQLLLRAGVGAEYAISRKFAVFLEPSLRYHIGNDTNIPQLYGRRLGMNFNLGLVFTP